MYPYNYNIRNNASIYTPAIANSNDERFIGGGLIAPLLLGGVAGYAIGQNNWNNNRPYMFYTGPYYNPYYYNNYYPYPYYRR